MNSIVAPASLDAAVHLVQSALTPVFLLSGIATLLNVYAGRLVRVSDRLDTLIELSLTVATPRAETLAIQILALRRRLLALDAALVLGAIGAAATCVAIMALFLLGLGEEAVSGILRFCFGGAVLCTLGSVGAFVAEMLISSRGLRVRIKAQL